MEAADRVSLQSEDMAANHAKGQASQALGRDVIPSLDDRGKTFKGSKLAWATQ